MNIKFLSLSWETTLIRYFLMMFVVIGGVLSGVYAIAFLGLPIFLSAILGVSISRKETKTNSGKVIKMGRNQGQKQKVS